MHTDNDAAVDVPWYEALACAVRDRRGDGDEGTTWVLFVDDERKIFVGMAIEPDGEIGQAEVDGLAEVIRGLDPPAVVVAVTRDEGEPLAADWRLWEELRGRLAVSRTELIDVVVVGRHSWWAVLGGRPDHAS